VEQKKELGGELAAGTWGSRRREVEPGAGRSEAGGELGWARAGRPRSAGWGVVVSVGGGKWLWLYAAVDGSRAEAEQGSWQALHAAWSWAVGAYV
jgi:hypothetical protein